MFKEDDMRPWLIGLSGATVLLAGIAATAPSAGANHERSGTPVAVTPIIGSPLLEPTIDLVAAQEIALEGQGGAHIAEVDLDGKDGVLTYRIVLDTGLDVEIDASTGEIVDTERDEHPGAVTAARQGKDDHDDDRRSARRGNRHHDGDDRSGRRGHRGHDDDRSARRGNHHHDDEVSVAPAGHPIQASGDLPQERIARAPCKPTQSSRVGCNRHEPASLCPCPNRDED
jgi:hypothetical protein